MNGYIYLCVFLFLKHRLLFCSAGMRPLRLKYLGHMIIVCGILLGILLGIYFAGANIFNWLIIAMGFNLYLFDIFLFILFFPSSSLYVINLYLAIIIYCCQIMYAYLCYSIYHNLVDCLFGGCQRFLPVEVNLLWPMR